MASLGITGGYRATAYDHYISCHTGQGVCSVTLPALTVVADGYAITITDADNNATNSNIGINTADGALINGQLPLTISVSGGSVTLFKSGQSWSATGEYSPTSTSSANISTYWSVQSATTSAVTVSPQTTYLACNFNGTMAVTLPASTAAGLVYGRVLFVQNQANTGNTTTNYVRIVGSNASTSVNGTNTDITISTALGGTRLVPTSTGWWWF